LPITKSAIKAVRVSAKKKLANVSFRSLCKTEVTKAEKLISSGQLDEAQKAVVAAISALDTTAEKGIIHRNNAARRKSRLMKKLNAAKTPSPA
jgi:small subunit ribosomal protein S20